MTIYTVLTGEKKIDSAAIRSGIFLAEKLHKRLVGLLAVPSVENVIPMISFSEVMGQQPMMTLSEVEEMQTNLIDHSEKTFRELVEGSGASITHAHIVERGSPQKVLSNAATLADVMIFPESATAEISQLHNAFEQVLLRARLPVFLSGSEVLKAGPVIVGWDGSPTAARAVRFHLPLMLSMGEAIIAYWPDEDDKKEGQCFPTPKELCKKLQQQGIQIQVKILEGKDVADGLEKLADQTGASIVVTGAYGHSRIEQSLFGGVTKDLLHKETKFALALAH